MDDLASVKASFEDQAVIFMRKHNWILSWLYLGTFGSFIGFAAGFPLLAETDFAGVDVTPYAFVGPLARRARTSCRRLARRPHRRGARRARLIRRDGAPSSRLLLARPARPGAGLLRCSSRCSGCSSSRAAPATARCSR